MDAKPRKPPPRAMSFARTCYDHLAGVVGVAILDSMLSQSWLIATPGRARADPSGYEVTDAGRRGLGELGVDVEAAATAKRSFTRPCLDWTERRPHLAGALGAAVATALIERGWVRRADTQRAVHLTSTGAAGLSDALGLQFDQIT